MHKVVWLKSALDFLATTWLAADPALRKAITDACQKVDADLAKDPMRNSESRAAKERTVFFSPLAVTFHLDRNRREVIISDLNLYQKRPKH